MCYGPLDVAAPGDCAGTPQCSFPVLTVICSWFDPFPLLSDGMGGYSDVYARPEDSLQPQRAPTPTGAEIQRMIEANRCEGTLTQLALS
jgi:hypothetical protein